MPRRRRKLPLQQAERVAERMERMVFRSETGERKVPNTITEVLAETQNDVPDLR